MTTEIIISRLKEREPFPGHSPPDGVKFERGKFEVLVMDDLWQDAYGWPRATKDKFNSRATYRIKVEK